MRAFAVTALGLSTLASGSEVEFTSSVGGSASITWDGTTLAVPQHCRESDCKNSANAIQMLQAELAVLRNTVIAEDNVLKTENAALRMEVAALRTTTAAALSALQADHDADVEKLMQEHDSDISATEAAFKAADAALGAAIDNVSKLPGPKGML